MVSLGQLLDDYGRAVHAAHVLETATSTDRANRARRALADRFEQQQKAIVDVLAAIAAADAAGCLDHTDCWEEANAKWYEPIARARALLKETR